MKTDIKSEMIKFQIDQLRKERMILAIESVALTFIVELIYVLGTVVLDFPYSPSFTLLALMIPLSYFMYMGISNIKKLIKIRQLEKEIYKK